MTMNQTCAERTVCVDLVGGLGNQCFILAAALAYGARTGRTVILCTEAETCVSITHRKTHWDSLFHLLPLAQNVQVCKIDSKEYQTLRKAAKTYKEPHFAYAPIPEFSGVNSVCLKGYFQSSQYFKSVESTIAQLFTLSEAQQQQSFRKMHVFAPLFGQQRTVSMHVRRGDYLKPNIQRIHGSVPREYYIDAMQQFDSDTVFYIFSDDYQWCNNEYAAVDNCVVVPNSFSDIEHFFLMTQCSQGHIMANSTFSRWAAYLEKLDTDKQKQVVTPKQWFGVAGPQDFSSIYELGWKVL